MMPIIANKETSLEDILFYADEKEIGRCLLQRAADLTHQTLDMFCEYQTDIYSNTYIKGENNVSRISSSPAIAALVNTANFLIHGRLNIVGFEHTPDKPIWFGIDFAKGVAESFGVEVKCEFLDKPKFPANIITTLGGKHIQENFEQMKKDTLERWDEVNQEDK